MKITILGLGGVGGVLGARLANHYASSNDVKISFLVREKALKTIKENGFTLEEMGKTITGKPHLVTSNASEIGRSDFLLHCTKTYDVEASFDDMEKLLDKGSIIIPFCNGVDSAERMRLRFPEIEVIDACVHVVSKKLSENVVSNSMASYSFVFGSENKKIQILLEAFSKVLMEADVSNLCTEMIDKYIWEKYCYVSSLATVTSLLDKTYGEIESDPYSAEILKKFVEEFVALAGKSTYLIRKDLAKYTLRMMAKIMPKDGTTSMQRDFRNHHKTELETMTGYIVRKSEEFKLDTPYYKRAYDILSKR